MTGDAALINLVRRTLRRLEEEMAPDDPAHQEVKASTVRSIAEFKVARMPESTAIPESKTASNLPGQRSTLPT
jgi:hypothetical protein